MRLPLTVVLIPLVTACVEIDVATAQAVAASAAQAATSAGSVCEALGSPAACNNFCRSLRSDACWNHYLGTLSPAMVGGSVKVWLLLNFASAICEEEDAKRTPVCQDWSILEPLEPSYRLDVLCKPSCAWPSMLAADAREFVRWNETGSLGKDTFCARRFDGEYCRLLVSPDDSSVVTCDLLRDGCGTYFRSLHGENTYQQRLSACHAEARAARAPSVAAHIDLLAPQLLEDTANVPVEASMPAVWVAAEGAFAPSNPAASGSSSASPPSSGRAAVRFRRVFYEAEVNGFMRRNLTGLIVEPIITKHQPLRGIFLYSAGTKAPADPALSELSTLAGVASGGALPSEHALLAIISQLGYAVVVPDGLGLGPSSSIDYQAYLLHEIVSAVSIELVRACLSRLFSTAGRFMPQRTPELWLMGGSHGGFVTAAVQRRLQTDSTLATLQRLLRGSFMHAAPLDVSGAMMDRLTSTEPYPRPWYLLLVGRALETYASFASFRQQVSPSFLPIYDSFGTPQNRSQWTVRIRIE